MTAAATTAVLATGEGPGETALATTAVFATGWPMTPTLPTRAALSGMSVSFRCGCFIGLDGGDDRLNGNPSVRDQLTTRTARSRCKRRRPEVLPDQHSGSASRLHGGGEVHDIVGGQKLRELRLDFLQRTEVLDLRELLRIHGTVLVLGQDQDVDHADRPGIDQREQLLCHFAREVARSRRKLDDEVVDWTELIEGCPFLVARLRELSRCCHVRPPSLWALRTGSPSSPGETADSAGAHLTSAPPVAGVKATKLLLFCSLLFSAENPVLSAFRRRGARRAPPVRGRGHTLHRRQLLTRVGCVPGDVAIRQWPSTKPVHEDRDADRRHDGQEQRALVGKRRLVDEDHGEDDRGEAARAEPTHERKRRAACSAPQQRERDRQHPDDRQAEHGVGENLPAQVVERGSEDDGAEDDERDGVE